MPKQSTFEHPSEVAADRESASAALIAHIQNTTEQQKALLARELHDELGGLLVGAVMDLAWAEQHLSARPSEVKQKLVRARQTLASAIDLKRKLIEELRPTLLDNVGLFAALRWHVQAACTMAAMACSIDLPGDERRFLPSVPIALFRIVQEACAVVVAHQHPVSMDFSITITEQLLSMRIVSKPAAPGSEPAGGVEPHELAAVRYRAATLGGAVTFHGHRAEGTTLAVTFPLDLLILAN